MDLLLVILFALVLLLFGIAPTMAAPDPPRVIVNILPERSAASGGGLLLFLLLALIGSLILFGQ